MRIRRTTHFTGNVQGVGFRYTTQNIAAGFEVSGFVRNLPDGRVEVVAEGDRDEIDRFEAAIRDRMKANISDVAASDADFVGAESGFTVRFWG